jgi:nitroreductase
MIEQLLNRRSIQEMANRIPEKDLDKIFQCALIAADHGLLRPWRFIVVGPNSKIKLQEMIAEGLCEDGVPLTDARKTGLLKKLERAPHIVVCIMSEKQSKKIPRSEQLLSAGAAVQSMAICAHLMGYGAFWRTGAYAYSKGIKKQLKTAVDDHIIGFLYLGQTNAIAPSRRKKTDLKGFFHKLEDL